MAEPRRRRPRQPDLAVEHRRIDDCLPAGLYTARVHTVVTDGVSQVDLYAPVAMTVDPERDTPPASAP